MRLAHALLVIVDISGYTDFITKRELSLLHAEQIITELMEAVIDGASHPLSVNKLEGDAALLYREFDPADAGAAATDVLRQVRGFFDAFNQCLARVRDARRGCGCEACGHTDKLCLKAFVHCGEIAVKQVRQFQELAGEPVILVHRLLKNSVAEREYVLVTEAVRAHAAEALSGADEHWEELESIGRLRLCKLAPSALPAPAGAVVGPGPAAPAFERKPGFHHLPAPRSSLLRRFWSLIAGRPPAPPGHS